MSVSNKIVAYDTPQHKNRYFFSKSDNRENNLEEFYKDQKKWWAPLVEIEYIDAENTINVWSLENDERKFLQDQYKSTAIF